MKLIDGDAMMDKLERKLMPQNVLTVTNEEIAKVVKRAMRIIQLEDGIRCDTCKNWITGEWHCCIIDLDTPRDMGCPNWDEK